MTLEKRERLTHAKASVEGLSVGDAFGEQFFGSTELVEALGNGSRVISQDTVPFALWCAARDLDSYENALWHTVSGLGDRDTTCAIVGGILGASSKCVIPLEWVHARESLLGEP